ncbi:MAG: hypothetical protein KY397_07075 [Gemmatimonadetes bacterium]|nr:hypothetical protein [Gemmatimonadota bacterium]
MSPRASLPGAEELFRRTTGPAREAKAGPQVAKSTKLQVADEPEATTQAAPATGTKKAPKHDEKVTYYCTAAELMALERARLALRADHATAADRGRIIRAALAYVLEDFDARSDDSILLRRLEQ